MKNCGKIKGLYLQNYSFRAAYCPRVAYFASYKKKHYIGVDFVPGLEDLYQLRYEQFCRCTKLFFLHFLISIYCFVNIDDIKSIYLISDHLVKSALTRH